MPTGPPTFSDPLYFTNRYMPFLPGNLKVYTVQVGQELTQVILDIYLDETQRIVWNDTTVSCRILKSIEFERGRLVSITRKFCAQADDGTVYYFGEIADHYDNGMIVSHEGSWLVGRPENPPDHEYQSLSDPTVLMPGYPEVGDRFKPEDAYPFLDETDEVRRAHISVTVPAGEFGEVIEVVETTLLDPESFETKWYAPRVGLVKGVDGEETLLLVATTLPGFEQSLIDLDFWRLLH